MACCKKIFIVFLLFVLLFSSFSFAATPVDPTEWNTDLSGAQQHDNIFNTLSNIELNYQNEFITKAYALYSQNSTEWRANMSYVFNDLIYSGSGQRGILVTVDGDKYTVSTYAFAEMVKNTSVFLYQYQNLTFQNTSFTDCTVSRRYLTSNNVFYGQSGEIGVASEPTAFYNVMSDKWIDMFIDFGIITSATDEKILYLLQQIYANSGSDISAKLNSINSNTEGIKNGINDVNNSIKDDNVNVDASTLPGDNTNDITESGFNNLFNKIYTTFTSGASKDLVVNVPFTEKSFVINSANVYGGADLGIVKVLIQSFWWFSISYFIVRDIGKKINKIKSGDIEHVEENNIKEDLL